MRPTRHALATAALLAAFAAGAFAQTPPPSAPNAGPRHEHSRMDPAKRQEAMNRRLAELKQQLGILPVQEGAWNAFVAAMQPPANMQRPDRAEWSKLTTPERIDRMKALRAQRDAEMDKRGEATKQLYAALTPEQRKAFDERRSRGARGGRGEHGAGHRHGPMQRG